MWHTRLVCYDPGLAYEMWATAKDTASLDDIVASAEGSEVTAMTGMGKWLRGVMLAGMSVLACGKPGASTKGPEARATDGSSANARTTCPEGMVRIEGNETLRPFCLGETEVSVKQFRRCVEAKAWRRN